MEEELTYPRYDDAGNLIEGPRVIQPEEEEVLEEDGGILNATQTSQSSVAQTILIDLLLVKIMTDVNHFSDMTQEQRFEWQTVLDIDYITKLIMQYFGTNKQRDHGDHTLAELFAKVPFHYSLNSDEEELSTYMAYKELVSNSERTRRITPNQNVELVTILEKRLLVAVVSNQTISSLRGATRCHLTRRRPPSYASSLSSLQQARPSK